MKEFSFLHELADSSHKFNPVSRTFILKPHLWNQITFGSAVRFQNKSSRLAESVRVHVSSQAHSHWAGAVIAMMIEDRRCVSEIKRICKRYSIFIILSLVYNPQITARIYDDACYYFSS